MKKLVAFALALGLLALVPVFGQAKKQIVLGKVPYTLEAAYHQSVIREWKSYGPVTYGVKVIAIDGEASSEKTLAAIENLIAQKVDGIALHTGDASVMIQAIKLAHAAGIPIVTTLIRPTQKLAPHIQPDEAPSSYKMGQVAATQWLKANPGKACRVFMLDFGGFEQIEEMRTGPFMKGVRNIDPKAVLVAQLNGASSTVKSMEITLDVLQKDSKVNIIFGANDEMALGALAACEQIGRGKMNNGKPLTEVIAGLDGNVAAMLKIYNPSSSFKLTHGAVRDNARAEIDTLMKMIRKEMPMDLYTEQKVVSQEFDFWNSGIEDAQKFLQDNFAYTGNLRAEVSRK